MLSRGPWINLRRKNRNICTALVICSLLFYSCHRSTPNTAVPNQHQGPLQDTRERQIHCSQTPIAYDVQVVFRTGATEILEKLPIHLNTTLRCIPHYTIFSDNAEEIDGITVQDALEDISPALKASVSDFALYHRLKTFGRDALSAGGPLYSGSGPTGAITNPGWKLDKFKFLPMVYKTLQQRPHAKWFVFVELDTYLMWDNLLTYLEQFDAKKPYYIGKQMFIGDVLFAHGGSGFVLSAAAMRKVTAHWKDNEVEYDRYTIEQWAGDMVLGKVVKDAGVSLLWAFPHFQGDPVVTLDHNVTKVDKRPWCYPAVTYHHMSVDEIQAFWTFEQEWRSAHPRDTLRHADVFKEYITPSLRNEKKEWDNYSVNLEFSKKALEGKDAHTSFDACRTACKSNNACLQFSYHASRCSVSHEVRLGRRATSQCLEYSSAASKCDRMIEVRDESVDPVSSGWMIERLAGYANDMDQTCDDSKGWVT